MSLPLRLADFKARRNNLSPGPTASPPWRRHHILLMLRLLVLVPVLVSGTSASAAVVAAPKRRTDAVATSSSLSVRGRRVPLSRRRGLATAAAMSVVMVFAAAPEAIAHPPKLRIGSTYAIESANFRGHFLRHQNGLAQISRLRSGLDRADATFQIVRGLAGSGISFRSVNYPNHYLRHQNYTLRLAPREAGRLYKEDASFHIVPGLVGNGTVSFKSHNYRNRYLRHYRGRVSATTLGHFPRTPARQDATWRAVPPPRSQLVCEEHNKTIWYAPNTPPFTKDNRRFAKVDLKISVCTRNGRIEQVMPTSQVEVTGPGRFFGTEASTDLPSVLQRTETFVSVDFPVTLKTCLGSIAGLPFAAVCEKGAKVAVRGIYYAPSYTRPAPIPLNGATWHPHCSNTYSCSVWAPFDGLERSLFR